MSKEKAKVRAEQCSPDPHPHKCKKPTLGSLSCDEGFENTTFEQHEKQCGTKEVPKYNIYAIQASGFPVQRALPRAHERKREMEVWHVHKK